MKYVTLGSANVRVSRFCLGTMMFGGKTDAAESIRITRRAIDAGINFVDTADKYSEGVCETIVGEALSDPTLRDQVVLATKAGMEIGKGVNDQGVSRFHFVRAVENSLKRLKTDRIDLYYIHWPMTLLNLEETLRTLDDLVRQGKILYAACSNFPAWLVMQPWILRCEALCAAGLRAVSLQRHRAAAWRSKCCRWRMRPASASPSTARWRSAC